MERDLYRWRRVVAVSSARRSSFASAKGNGPDLLAVTVARDAAQPVQIALRSSPLLFILANTVLRTVHVIFVV